MNARAASRMNDAEDPETLKSALVFFGNQPSCPDVEDLVFAQIDHKYVDVKEMALEACINLHSPRLNQLFKERARSEDPLQRMFSTVIGVDTHFREASAQGCTIYDIDARSRGARGYDSLAEEVVKLC